MVTDNKFAKHLGVSLFSLLYNNNWITHVNIINSDLQLYWKDFIKKIAENFEVNLKFINFNKELISDFKINDHFALENYYRLFIPELISDKTALYLDSDTIVECDLSDLCSPFPNNIYIKAVHEAYYRHYKKLTFTTRYGYFNSGVMLMNLELIRKKNLIDKTIEFIRSSPEKLTFVDQCALNYTVNGAWEPLHPRYNVQSSFNDLVATSKNNHLVIDQIEEALSDPYIVHFTGGRKPWHLHCQNFQRHSYWKYVSLMKRPSISHMNIRLKDILS